MGDTISRSGAAINPEESLKTDLRPSLTIQTNAEFVEPAEPTNRSTIKSAIKTVGLSININTNKTDNNKKHPIYSFFRNNKAAIKRSPTVSENNQSINTDESVVYSPLHNDLTLAQLSQKPSDLEEIKNKLIHHKNGKIVLCFEGGGSRAVVEAYIIKELAKATEHRITEIADYFVGTSAGSMLAILYTLPSDENPLIPKYTEEEVYNIVRNEGHLLFETKEKKSPLHAFTPSNPLAPLYSPKYKSKDFLATVESYAGDKKMRDCIKPTTVTAYNTDTNQIDLISSFDGGNLAMKDAITGSSAA